ncbi:MAG: glycosyltransferase family 9 protein, partial [Bdellovibrionales bacterium]|nr:glycosyltransferase family 9 protein [Bdellovibrionales bacterium]
MRNILIVAITRMGDLLQASPTIVGMRREYPHARITVLVDKQFSSICRGIPGIDELYETDLAMIVRGLHREGDGLVDAYDYLTEIIEDLKARHFDYCLNMASSGYTALLIGMLNIPESRGWTSDAEGFRIIANPWSRIFAAFVYHSNRLYNSLNLVDILRCAAGVTQHPHRLMYEVNDADRQHIAEFLRPLGTEGPLLALQAGASQGKRQWAPARFARLLKALVEEQNARIVLTGSKSESHIADAILSFYNSPRILNGVGKTNLGQLGALLEQAEVLVTGDTGPMHLAVAVGTPVVALFLASALCFETGPYGEGNIVIQPQITCNPCNPNFACARPDCHEQVTPELVAELVRLRRT